MKGWLFLIVMLALIYAFLLFKGWVPPHISGNYTSIEAAMIG